MKIGIRHGSLGGPEMDEMFRMAAEIGFDGVELEVSADYEETMLSTDEGRGELVRMSREAGVDIPSLCVGGLWSASPAATDPDLLARSRYLIDEAIEAAVAVGARWILIPVTPSEEEISHEECQRRWIQEMKRAAAIAEQADVILCLENVGRGCGKSAEELKAIADAVASSHVKTYWDMGNACNFGNDAIREIELLAEILGMVHVEDYNGTLLGEGEVDIPGCIQQLREIGYDGWLVLETPPTDNPLEAGNYNLAYLREIVG
ncbi:MAG: sugar phosphate isomerase/epimerase [Armatimonadetes bacterium]|nr:sugar phosphate isomerase/epimerase [Armatimonadota bacterium]